MKWLTCALFAVLMAVAFADVVINGVCKDCSPPVAETVVVGGKAYNGGAPGRGTVYINGQNSYPNARPDALSPSNRGNAAGSAPYAVPEGYSGPVPGGSYVHNTDCNGCDIRG